LNSRVCAAYNGPAVDPRVRELFHELADVPQDEREKLLAERRIAPEVRSEVESLLTHDASSGPLFTTPVYTTAEAMLRDGGPREPSYCGPYRIIRQIGSGGMGVVFLAERCDGELQQKVAIKLLRAGADRPSWRDRFLKERQLLATLNHPSIAHVLDAGHTEDGRPYLVMEYVDGAPIDIYAASLDLHHQLLLFLRVCEGVSHAHRRLIIHRDLKPSNILVDASGQPKLLDFGIAKLLDESEDTTLTLERRLTPGYASPEQVCGANQTTATDVYSLGAVFYKMLTGRLPREQEGAPKLPADIVHILRRSLREEPDERYASVEAFANDIRAFLGSRPVQARSGNAWYRTRKFFRRYWLPSTAAIVAIISLSVGLYIANRERAVAQRRFQQVRHLANQVLGLDRVVRGLPGATKARQELVAISKDYLEGLTAEARSDQKLALEIGMAYDTLARVQGVPTATNLGQPAEAEKSLKKAEALLERVLKADPRNRKALLATASVAQSRMILAQIAHRDGEALAQARKAAARLDSLLSLGAPSLPEASDITGFLGNIALAHTNMHLYPDAIRYGRRAIDTAQLLPTARWQAGSALSVVADSMRLSGDLEGALEAMRESIVQLENAQFSSELTRFTNLSSALWRAGVILGEDGDVNLGRPDDAIPMLQRAMDLAEELARRDPSDSKSRTLVAQAGRELGDILRHSNPRKAEEVYNQALTRLREIEDNQKARRDEAHILANSAFALRRLGRAAEARSRIDSAFRLLEATKDYPASRINPGDEVDAAMRAMADHEAETGHPVRAAEIYEELLEKIRASKPNPQDDLRHATNLSAIYAALARLHGKTGESRRADAMSAQRIELWRSWAQKLPNNAFVTKQVAEAQSQ
jgi:serine/threonine protein kinase